MKMTRFNETQIVSILEETDAGMKVADICRKHGISGATYYDWKSKYGGMEASDLKHIKEFESELARENDAMRVLIAKKCCGRTTTKRLGHGKKIWQNSFANCS